MTKGGLPHFVVHRYALAACLRRDSPLSPIRCEQGIAAWLTERRPLLWQLLGEQQELNDGNAVGMLLDLLHSSDGLPSKAYQIYRQINQHLQKHPLLIWPMLIRAEGWHRCREEVRGHWGWQTLWCRAACTASHRTVSYFAMYRSTTGRSSRLR